MSKINFNDKIVIRRISFAPDFDWEVFGTGRWENCYREDSFRDQRSAYEYAYRWCEECRIAGGECEVVWSFE